MRTLIKKIIRKIFYVLGYHIELKSKKNKVYAPGVYFNNGALSPLEQNTQEINDQFYSDEKALQEYYDANRLSFYDSTVNHIISKGIDLNNKKVLDVGCGTGHLLEIINKHFSPSSLSGTDFSVEAVNYGKKYFPKYTFFTSDIYEQLPGQYDFIVSSQVFEHLEYPHRALKNLIKNIAPGGTLMLTVPNGRVDTLAEHINFWSPESWKIFITENSPGFSIDTQIIPDSKVNCALISLI